MSSPDNVAALIYLKNKVHKWKNVAIIFACICIYLSLRLIAGDNLSGGIAEGNYIAEINIEGVILEDAFRSQILKEIEKETAIKALIVNINSPGGGIVGSEILFEDLRKISAKKPIVVTLGSVAASGGYMAALAADHIIARNGTITGSIGVLMQTAEYTDLAKKVGITFNNYKSSPLKAAPSPFEKTTPKIDRVVNQSIQDSYQFFADLVRQRRVNKLPRNTSDILDGRVFNGRQALAVGLVDEIGGKDQALEYLFKTHKIDTKNLKVRQVLTTKEEVKLYDKLLGYLPFFKEAKSLHEKQGMMAIMSL